MQFDCTTIYAHTFVEIELHMHRAKRGAMLTILITEEGTGDCRYPLEKGQARVYIKKNKRCSPFYEDCGTWLLDSHEVNGQHIVRDFMHRLTRCGYKYLVTIEEKEAAANA